MKSLMDLIEAKSTAVTPESLESSIQVEAEPEVIKRSRALLKFVIDDVAKNPHASKKFVFMMRKIVEEAMAELDGVPPEIVADNMARVSAAMYWVSTGGVIENLPVPDGFWDSVGFIPSIPPKSSPKEIGDGTR